MTDYPATDCPCCGGSVERSGRSSRLVYCSAACRRRAKDRRRYRNRQDRAQRSSYAVKPSGCLKCEAPITQPRTSMRLYCDQCSTGDHPRVCVDCECTFRKWQGWKHPGAAGARCHPCYLDYTRRRQTPGAVGQPRRRRMTDREYISNTLNRHPWHQALSQLRSCKRLQQMRAQVLSEETHCHICGDEVDMSLPGTHVDGPTIDHLIPVGTPQGIWHIFDRRLVRLAHRRCNCTDGNRIQRRIERERQSLALAGRWLGAHLNGGGAECRGLMTSDGTTPSSARP